MTPEDTAFVLTSASSRGAVPSEKKRLPAPNRTGKTSNTISSASSCSSGSVSASSCPRRSGAARPPPSCGGRPPRCCVQDPRRAPRQDCLAGGSRWGVRPITAPDIIGSAAQQQIEVVAVSRRDRRSPFGVVMRRHPSAVREAATAIFFRTTGALNHAVQRDLFDDSDLSYSGLLSPTLQRSHLVRPHAPSAHHRA